MKNCLALAAVAALLAACGAAPQVATGLGAAPDAAAAQATHSAGAGPAQPDTESDRIAASLGYHGPGARTQNSD